ncbi:OLC1v1001742C1 [Oldenlandia corymbosa var. corymbosa]|uniref:OLC1v1001742C1 n=1 Tax=Oldenlandia corymbosa var. corymbosa TaxID=529605 RepID=A0AAV1D5Y0_OLDCO|nr:OLC1v1001742C1 [Oldenlandia corymbosa var. corymbosa]
MNECSGSRLTHFDQRTSPVKSIKSRDGDVIDCVHISNQPASDQPLGSNNDLQKRLSNPINAKKSIPQAWHLEGSCPDGTIAVKRTTQEDRIRANSINSFDVNSMHQNSFQATSNTDTSATSTGFHQYATAYVIGEEYYGAMATMNLWAPKVRPNEFSSSKIWVIGGSGSDLNVIVAGWHVYPGLYGDNKTRFYTYWTGDNFQSTGCYNLLCQGFVQTSNKFALGAPFPELSEIDGSQSEFTVIIFKGKNGWVLQFDDFVLGYWPFSLFTNLKDNASWIEWGGLILNSNIGGKQSTTTQMGSGHFPEEGLKRAGYMRQLQVFNESLYSRRLDSPIAMASHPNCYNIKLSKNKVYGDFIVYGGPGKNPKCP